MDDLRKDPFEEYKRESEPGKRERYKEILNDPSLTQFTGEKLITSVKAPVLMIIPIAIYV